MDRLIAMRVFVEIVDRGSVSAAADALDMSRAMASRYLEGLERWLGVRLLHRTTRKLALSDAGEQALKGFREMVALAGDVHAQASQQGEVQGRLRITSSPAFAQAQLTAAVVDFQRLYPKVEIDMMMVDRTVDLVQERIDLAIRLSNRIDEALVARRLAVCHSVLCASPSYLARAGIPEMPEDLKRHRCVVHSAAFAPTYNLRCGDARDSGEKTVTVSPHAVLTANDTSILRAGALAGAGIAMLPTFYVTDELARKQLQIVLPAYTLDALDIQAVYLSRRHQPLPLRKLVEFLSERFGGDTAPWDRKQAVSGN
ncbi:DNA-binding transcriptional LysR family regulator [Variovorax boronicumulans]|uniref:LysR family transcriptional regulator n=1 Tax=Variovorax boronicumulans TaxID=436515 RepID=UPI002787BE3F|nr:LysR family transcriptional regulator [Variovorax boronicumulans]MDP9994005.1 DNA-binding transcriptional LysR family regulator [Variovorax boronicumulans]MDQ0005132.1 DNA-binding transcriptional LysR family regulator [Variovorax boronicumulans]